MALTFNHVTKRIVVTTPQTSIAIQDLVDAVRAEEASESGITDSEILYATGKQVLDTGVAVGITALLLGTWQIEWWPGNYTAKIGGGNLVAESGDAVAYVVGGPQVEITLSAAATIVTEGGSIPTVEAIREEIDANSTQLERIKDIVEADEELTPTTAKKRHRTTKAELLSKTVAGGNLAGTISLTE